MTNANQIYRDKLYFRIVKPMTDYYKVNLDEEIIQSFCRSLSFYKYEVVCEVRDELLAKYKTFPRLPNWIARCKEKQKTVAHSPDIPQEIKDGIEEIKDSHNWQVVQQKLKEEYGDATYASWLSKIILVKETSEEVLMAGPTGFITDWIIKEQMMDGKFRKIKRDDGTETAVWIKKGIVQFWQEMNPNLKSIVLRDIKTLSESLSP